MERKAESGMAEPTASPVSTAQGELGCSRQTHALRLGPLYPRHHRHGLNGAVPQDSHRKAKVKRVPGAPLCVGDRDSNRGPHCVLWGLEMVTSYLLAELD